MTINSSTPIGLQNHAAEDCVMVIFGGTGDLAKRKLLPSLYNLVKQGLLPDKFAIVGTGSKPLELNVFKSHLLDAIREYAGDTVDTSLLDWFEKRISYVGGRFDDPDFYQRIGSATTEAKEAFGIGDRHFYYLSTSPDFFGEIIEQLNRAGLAKDDVDHWRRFIIEKPFGHDLASAIELNNRIKKILQERQIFRIDHYLGKETVQNLMVLRFANSIFEPIWNRRYIESVQITAAETVGVEMRAPYYEGAGALKDMVPNHLLQLVSLTAMEPPVSFEADAVRDEQTKLLRAIQVLAPEDVLKQAVRGQYGPGQIGDRDCIGYREEPNVKPNSETNTFVALKLMVDNWRWAGVPFYIRTGKRMSQRYTNIVITFQKAPLHLFSDTSIESLRHNRLVIRIQPDEGVALEYGAKIPGPSMKLGKLKMDFSYQDYFGQTPNTGYERLMLDCMLGDATLFQRADMVEAGWSLIQPIIDVWQALPPRDFPNYAAGSFGPEASDHLLAEDGKTWYNAK